MSLPTSLSELSEEQIREGYARLGPEERERLDAWLKRRHHASDAVTWGEEKLGEFFWSEQRKVLRSLANNRYTAVPSAHDVGKSFAASRIAAHWLDTHPPGEAFVVSCYTDDTEVLTKDGWKLFQDVRTGTEGDLFATRNPSTKAFEWQRAFRYYEAPWDGEVVDIRGRNGRSVNLRVTPNHRVLVKWSDATSSGEFLKPAEKITQRGAEIPVTSIWQGEPPSTVRFGKYEWDSVTFASFLGAWIAEGSLGPARNTVRKSNRKRRNGANEPSGPIAITQLQGTKGYEEYLTLLTSMLGRQPAYTGGKTWVFSCSDLWHYLAKLGKAATKSVPTEVKNWGRAELEAFLHFYLLGDGWINRSSSGRETWRSVTVSKRLADDLQEIAQKVGLSATIGIREPRDACIDGRKIAKENCLPGYYVHFNVSECKSATASRSHYKGNVYCVSVPNEVLFVRRGGGAVWCGNTAPTFPQVKAILWREIGAAHAKGELSGKVNQTEWWIGSKLVGFGRKPNDYDMSAFQGIHAKYVLVIIDEAGGVPKLMFDAVDTLVTNEFSRVLAIGNPDDPQSHFATVCEPDSGWEVLEIDGLRSPNFTAELIAPYPELVEYMAAEGIEPSSEEVPEALRPLLLSPLWVAERIKRWGTDSPMFAAKVRGRFPKEDDQGTIKHSWLVQAQQVTGLTDAGLVVLGVDVGAGGDRSVIQEKRGAVFGRCWESQHNDPERLTGEIVAAVVETEAEHVNIDGTGVGWGIAGSVRTALEARGLDYVTVEAVMVGEAANDSEHFVNRKAETWWAAREAIRQLEWDISQLDDIAISELSKPRYFHDGRGRIRIESKADLKKRIKKSPDKADAVILAGMGKPSADWAGLDLMNNRSESITAGLMSRRF